MLTEEIKVFWNGHNSFVAGRVAINNWIATNYSGQPLNSV